MACGFGVATSANRKLVGTFWKNKQYGIVTTENSIGEFFTIEYNYVGDDKISREHGKATLYSPAGTLYAPDADLYTNQAYSEGDSFC